MQNYATQPPRSANPPPPRELYTFPPQRPPWESPNQRPPQKLYFSPDIYNRDLEATPQRLARAMNMWRGTEPARALEVQAKYRPEKHGPMPQFMRSCLDMVWLADDCLGTAIQGVPVPYVDSKQREACLAFMWAVQHNGTIEDGEKAVEAARHVEWSELLTVLGLEAANAVTASAGFAACNAGAYYVGTAGASAAGNAWAMGGMMGKAKAAAWLFGGVMGAAMLVSVGLGVAGQAYRNGKDLETWRRECLAEQVARDGLFCEIITHRRYRREQVQP